MFWSQALLRHALVCLFGLVLSWFSWCLCDSQEPGCGMSYAARCCGVLCICASPLSVVSVLSDLCVELSQPVTVCVMPRIPPLFWLVVVIVRRCCCCWWFPKGPAAVWLARASSLCSLCHAVSRLVACMWTPLCPCFL